MNICVWGDSIAWGANDPEQGGWVNRLRNYCEAQKDDVHVYNLGISGDDTADVLERIEGEAKAREPDLAIFAIGTNDAQFVHSRDAFRVSETEYKQNLGKLCELARKFTDRLVFIGLTSVDESKTTPIPWNPDKSYTNARLETLNGIIKELCNEKGLAYIPVEKVLRSGDFADGLHPNSQGHQKLFEVIKDTLERGHFF